MSENKIELSDTDLQELHWFNIPGLPSKPITQVDPFFKSLYKVTNQPKDKPVFVYLWNGKIQELEKITHDEETVKILNEKGLCFYLYEPMCYKLDSMTEHNQSFYSEFESFKKMSLVSDELDSIVEYKKRNNITNISVYTCDYDANKYFFKYFPHFNLHYYDIFVRNLNTDKIFLNKCGIQRRFICLNWRYSKHRHILSSYLADKSVFMSWYFRVTPGDLIDNLWFDFDSWQDKHPKYHEIVIRNQSLLSDLNFNLDLAGIEKTNVKETWHHYNHWPKSTISNPADIDADRKNISYFYNRIFVSVVNETRFAQPTGNFSEKVFQAVDHGRPFILASAPKSLECLKKYGFRTFHDFWDESYDDEHNHEQRIVKILDVLEYINSLSFEDLQIMLNKMKKILKHNKRILDSLRKKIND